MQAHAYIYICVTKQKGICDIMYAFNEVSYKVSLIYKQILP